MNFKLRTGLVALMGLLLSIVVLLIGVSIGATLSGEITFLRDSVATWIASLATVVIALLTILLAFETQAMRRLQQEQIDGIRADAIRPDLDIYLVQSAAGFNFADLVLRNNGSGLARRVKVNFSVIPERGVLQTAEKLIKLLEVPSFVSNGISTLGPGRDFSSYILSFIELSDEADVNYFEVAVEAHISYLDADGNLHESTSVIDLAEFDGMSVLGGMPMQDAVKELKKISSVLVSFSNGSKKLPVNTHTSSDRKNEQEALKKKHAEAKRRREIAKSES